MIFHIAALRECLHRTGLYRSIHKQRRGRYYPEIQHKNLRFCITILVYLVDQNLRNIRKTAKKHYSIVGIMNVSFCRRKLETNFKKFNSKQIVVKRRIVILLISPGKKIRLAVLKDQTVLKLVHNVQIWLLLNKDLSIKL